jgi:hypothetical protein
MSRRCSPGPRDGILRCYRRRTVVLQTGPACPARPADRRSSGRILSTAAVAVCCCSDSRNSLRSRVFSMAMTAWSAKLPNSICFSVKGWTLVRRITMTPMMAGGLPEHRDREDRPMHLLRSAAILGPLRFRIARRRFRQGPCWVLVGFPHQPSKCIACLCTRDTSSNALAVPRK